MRSDTQKSLDESKDLIFCKFITKNGKRIYAGKGKTFCFSITKSKPTVQK